MSNALMTQTIERISQALDPKKGILDELKGAHEKYTLYDDDVLVATYIRPEKTAGGIIMTTRAKEEDRYQGKAGLLLKIGPAAFKYDRTGQYSFEGDPPAVMDWVVYRPSDNWEISLNGVSCRVIRSSMLRGSIADPALIW